MQNCYVCIEPVALSDVTLLFKAEDVSDLMSNDMKYILNFEKLATLGSLTLTNDISYE